MDVTVAETVFKSTIDDKINFHIFKFAPTIGKFNVLKKRKDVFGFCFCFCFAALTNYYKPGLK